MSWGDAHYQSFKNSLPGDHLFLTHSTCCTSICFRAQGDCSVLILTICLCLRSQLVKCSHHRTDLGVRCSEGQF